jgi:hypothetical protein
MGRCTSHNERSDDVSALLHVAHLISQPSFFFSSSLSFLAFQAYSRLRDQSSVEPQAPGRPNIFVPSLMFPPSPQQIREPRRQPQPTVGAWRRSPQVQGGALDTALKREEERMFMSWAIVV